MATKKYLDLDGLTRYNGKIKQKIPTKTSDLTNDSGFITDSKIVIIEYGENILYSTVLNYLQNGYSVFCKCHIDIDMQLRNDFQYIPAVWQSSEYNSITFCGVVYNAYGDTIFRNIDLKYQEENGVEIYGYWNNNDEYLQDELVSGKNIKTINNQSLLGYGNISTDKDILSASKASATTNYSTSHKNFLPFISTGDYSVDVQIGTGLTWTTKSVSFEEITGTTYGILIPSGISLVKVEANVRYQNPASSQININTMIMRDRNGTSTSLRAMSQSVIANSRYTCNFATYVPVQEGDFIYIGSWKSTASANVSVSEVDNATGIMLEVIQ